MYALRGRGHHGSRGTDAVFAVGPFTLLHIRVKGPSERKQNLFSDYVGLTCLRKGISRNGKNFTGPKDEGNDGSLQRASFL